MRRLMDWSIAIRLRISYYAVNNQEKTAVFHFDQLQLYAAATCNSEYAKPLVLYWYGGRIKPGN